MSKKIFLSLLFSFAASINLDAATADLTKEVKEVPVEASVLEDNGKEELSQILTEDSVSYNSGESKDNENVSVIFVEVTVLEDKDKDEASQKRAEEFEAVVWYLKVAKRMTDDFSKSLKEALENCKDSESKVFSDKQNFLSPCSQDPNKYFDLDNLKKIPFGIRQELDKSVGLGVWFLLGEYLEKDFSIKEMVDGLINDFNKLPTSFADIFVKYYPELTKEVLTELGIKN